VVARETVGAHGCMCIQRKEEEKGRGEEEEEVAEIIAASRHTHSTGRPSPNTAHRGTRQATGGAHSIGLACSKRHAPPLSPTRGMDAEAPGGAVHTK
jgi:hypothetical protein